MTTTTAKRHRPEEDQGGFVLRRPQALRPTEILFRQPQSSAPPQSDVALQVPATLKRPAPTRVTPPRQRPPAVVLDEDDDDDEQRHPDPQQPSQKEVQHFYKEAENLPGVAVHQAVIAGAEWHRKWTRQEVTGHGLTEEDVDGPVVVLPATYRYEGAKNPSLESCPQSQPGVQLVLDDDDEEEEQEEAEMGAHAISTIVLQKPIALRPLQTAAEDDVDDTASPLTPDEWTTTCNETTATEKELEQPVVILRPVALRVQCPPTIPQHVQHINKANKTSAEGSIISSRTMSTCSPLTLPSGWTLEYSEKSHLPIMVPADEDDTVTQQEPDPQQVARQDLLHQLAVTAGAIDEATNEKFTAALQVLQHSCLTGRSHGTWLTLTEALYFGCLGKNDNGDPLYTMGRLSFDMFGPVNLVCSLQGTFNRVETVSRQKREQLLKDGLIPKSLQEAVESADGDELQVYDIVAAFTVELPQEAFGENSPNRFVYRPIRGTMSTYGYTLSDPVTPNRRSVWITGGTLDIHEEDLEAWKQLLQRNPVESSSWTRTAKLLAVKWLMGAEFVSDTEYVFRRPLGGHGVSYVDTLYVDGSLRIVRGHRGTLFCFTRI